MTMTESVTESFFSYRLWWSLFLVKLQTFSNLIELVLTHNIVVNWQKRSGLIEIFLQGTAMNWDKKSGLVDIFLSRN